VTVHTNAIVVTISIADLIGGAATQTFARAANTLAPPLLWLARGSMRLNAPPVA